MSSLLFSLSPSSSLTVALLLTLLGGLLLWLGRGQRRRSGLPAGALLYRDVGTWQATERPLRSRRYGLVGRPDYLVQTRAGADTFVVPVEVKSRARPRRPYSSHVLQLATYCLLVEDNLRVCAALWSASLRRRHFAHPLHGRTARPRTRNGRRDPPSARRARRAPQSSPVIPLRSLRLPRRVRVGGALLAGAHYAFVIFGQVDVEKQ